MYKLYFDKYCHVNNTSFNVITGARNIYIHSEDGKEKTQSRP